MSRAAPLTASAARHLAAGLAIRTGSEWVPIGEIAGRTLAQHVRATAALPVAPTAAMDGWAVRAAETPGRLVLRGESAAGHPMAAPLPASGAARIATGAVLPIGADSVVRREEGTEADGVLIAPGVREGRDTRLAGGDCRRGQVLLQPGTAVRTHEVGVIAAAGHTGALCRTRPRVAIVATGDELVPPGSALPPGGRWDSNRPAAMAQSSEAGATVCWTAHCGDDQTTLGVLIDRALSLESGDAVNLLVTLGGVSVGRRDYVLPALHDAGVALIVDGTTMRPGRPTRVGVHGQRRVLALPGNPAAAMVGFHLLGRPLLGRNDRWLPMQMAVPYRSNGRADDLIRCRGTEWGLVPLDLQGSAEMSSLAGADFLAWLGWGRSTVRAGDMVRASPLG